MKYLGFTSLQESETESVKTDKVNKLTRLII